MRKRPFKRIFHFKSLYKGGFKIVEAPHFNVLQMEKNLFI